MHPIPDQIKREMEERRSGRERDRDKEPHTRHRTDLKHKNGETIDEHHNSLPVPRSCPLHHQVPAQGVDLSGQVANSARFPKQEPVPVLAASSLALGAADHKILCSVRGMLQEALLLGPSLADLNNYLSRVATWMPFRVKAE